MRVKMKSKLTKEVNNEMLKERGQEVEFRDRYEDDNLIEDQKFLDRLDSFLIRQVDDY